MGNPKVGLNRLSLASASSAVSLSRFSTSSNNSTLPGLAESERPRDPQIEQRLRRQPARAARLDQDPLISCCGSVTCVVAAHGLPLKYCRLAATTKPVHGKSSDSDDAEDMRPVVRQPALRIRQVVRILSERRLGRAIVLNCASSAAAPLDDLQARTSGRTCRTRTPANHCDSRLSRATTSPL